MTERTVKISTYKSKKQLNSEINFMVITLRCDWWSLARRYAPRVINGYSWLLAQRFALRVIYCYFV